MSAKIQKICVGLFSGGAALVWLRVCYMAAVSLNETKKIGLLALGLLVVFLFLTFLTEKLSGRLKNEKRFWRGASLTLLLLMAAGLLYCGLQLRVYPGWDFGSVYQGAVEIAEDGAFSESSNWYFTTYPNNVAVCMFLAVFFKIFGGLCSYITLGVLLNVGLIVLGVAFLFLLAEQLYGGRMAWLALAACACFLPFYMHSAIFYTDTFALPFVTGCFLSYQLRKKDARFLLLTAAVLAVGYKVKGSLGVILIALLIHIWLEKEKAAERMKKSLLLLIPFLALVGALTVIPQKMPFFDATDSYQNEFPVEHWLALGLTGVGGYDANVYWMTASVEGKAEKQETDRTYIKEKLEEYGSKGLRQHLDSKIVFTWGDGVYFAPEKLKRDPLRESWLHSRFLYDGVDYAKTYRYCNAVQLLLLGGILLSLLVNFFGKCETREIQAMQIAVFGLFLFLLIWETRSRYLVNFVPIFILLGIDGIQEIRSLLPMKKNGQMKTEKPDK